jgi:hypothetical protein
MRCGPRPSRDGELVALFVDVRRTDAATIRTAQRVRPIVEEWHNTRHGYIADATNLATS